MPRPAAHILGKTICPLINMIPPIPHIIGGIIIDGCFDVLIVGRPAATIGKMVFCVGPIPHPSTIILGSFTVLIHGKPAARMGDITDMGNIIIDGAFTVEIGD